MKEFHIYSHREGFKILDTYVRDKRITEKTITNELTEFLNTLYKQGLFLGHEGEIIPHLSRKL